MHPADFETLSLDWLGQADKLAAGLPAKGRAIKATDVGQDLRNENVGNAVNKTRSIWHQVEINFLI